MKASTGFLLLLLILLLFVILGGCADSDPTAPPSPPRDPYSVTYLFERNGCNVYRFHDYGSYRYFATCAGSVEQEMRSGKHTRYDGIPTGSK